ncbi:MAG: twin-arginine translocase subunit TatC [Gaiellales bacterium]
MRVPRRVTPEEQIDLVDHLDELRSRIIIVLAVLAVAMSVLFWKSGEILHFLSQPIRDQIPHWEGFLVLSPLDQIMTSISIAIYGALIITLPVLTYQIYAFILPAFPEEHHKHIKPMVWSVPILFLLGVVFAWYLVVPPAFDFLINFNQDQFNVQLRAKEYIQFVLLTLLAMGIVFEMPMVMMTLGRLGIVSSAMMKRHWRISIVGLAVLAMLLPGVDPISYIVEFIPLLVLYGLSYFLVKLVEPKPASPPQSEPTPG